MGTGFWIAIVFGAAAFCSGLMIGSFNEGAGMICHIGEDALDCARAWQPIVAGLLGLLGGYLAYRAIRSQINSTERQYWRDRYKPTITAIGKTSKNIRKIVDNLEEIKFEENKELNIIRFDEKFKEMIGINNRKLIYIHNIDVFTRHYNNIEKIVLEINSDFFNVLRHNTSIEQQKQLINDLKRLLRRLHNGLIVTRTYMMAGYSLSSIDRELKSFDDHKFLRARRGI